MGDLTFNLGMPSSDARGSGHPLGGLRAIAETAADIAASKSPAVAGVIVNTQGSTYRKRGAVILLDQDGVKAGALSGGCLESDIAQHARNVLTVGCALISRFDTRTDDDRVYGSGVGCKGEMTVLLMPLPADDSPLRNALVD